MRFSKWHALGNAYLVVERADIPGGFSATLATRLCEGHTGVGADGVLEVEASGRRAAVTVWNPDGSTAEFSGNGARIAAAWIAARAPADEVVLAFGEREVAARVEGGDVELVLGAIEVGEPEELEVLGERLTFIPVSVGNPHAVVRRDFDDVDVERLGPLVESHTRFPGRTNVQLVEPLDEGRIRVGVWERGAGATRSSGSSAVAAAAAAVANGWVRSPVTVELPGGELRVAFEDGRATLAGPVEEICRGEVVAAGIRALN